ncbi:hypothetical protein MVEG_02804 [Podila verticillata NRRL 6337]|nr:hypothetical protein MVEG_02804 [Podila verticillata NRRL 6337]
MFDIPELNEMVLLLLDQNPWPDVRESAKSGTMSPAHTSGESSPCLHAEASNFSGSLFLKTTYKSNTDSSNSIKEGISPQPRRPASQPKSSSQPIRPQN